MEGKTAIQELIEDFEKLKKTKLYENSFKGIDDCIFLALEKLESEKEAIINAYRKGFEDEGGLEENSKEYALEYFNDITSVQK